MHQDERYYNKVYIVNLQDSTQGTGTHWTCFGISDYEHLYFDSYGFPAPNIIEEILNKNYLWNDTQIQHLNAETCGWFCLAFMYFIQNTKLNKFNGNTPQVGIKKAIPLKNYHILVDVITEVKYKSGKKIVVNKESFSESKIINAKTITTAKKLMIDYINENYSFNKDTHYEHDKKLFNDINDDFNNI